MPGILETSFLHNLNTTHPTRNFYPQQILPKRSDQSTPPHHNSLRLRHKRIRTILRRKPKAHPWKIIVNKQIPPIYRITHMILPLRNARLIPHIIRPTEIYIVVEGRGSR